VFLRDDQVLLTGDAAERRGSMEPTRLAREFKRRVGDSVPILLGGVPYSAERLMATLLQQVVEAITEREGSAPAHVAVCHPANWGPFKTDLLRHALDLAGLTSVTLLTEPGAAAVHYATKEHIEPGSVVAVYDLGGGTFDAAVLRKTETGFESMGEPDGIERLGGIDFDEAIFAHVRAQLGDELQELDGSDPSVRVAIARLRHECVAAKEGLSADSETTIPVALPNVHTGLRLTRAELEPMIQPAIAETIEALRRAIRRAGCSPDDLTAVLLVGGSSQIPLVPQMVVSALGRPVAIDAHPKNSVALGAAVVAARAVRESAASPPAPVPAPANAAGPPARPSMTATVPADPLATAATAAPGPRRFFRSKSRIAVAAAAMVLVGVATAGAFALGSDSDADARDAQASAPTTAGAAGSTSTTAAPEPTCTSASASGRCARIVALRIEGDRYVADYEVDSFDPLTPENGGSPDDHHVHFFFDTTAPGDAGTNSATPGPWTVWDRTAGGGELRFDRDSVAEAAGARQLCVLVADAVHGVEQGTGNCVDLPE
jgi:actin-like ATPase involved in cell morphogenesis